MVELVGAAASALWLGILTSISPCPLATNIAAVSYICRDAKGAASVVRTSVLYALGRMAAYVGLGAALVYGLLAAPTISHALQKHMIRVIGPALLLASVLLLGWIPLPWSGLRVGDRLRDRAANRGAFGAAGLGFLFALTFCPVSAALFFGALLPVAIEARSAVLVPSAYGIGTALPVVVVAGAIAAGASQVARVFERTARFETWARRLTAAVFVLIGVWFTVRYTLRLGS